LISALPSWPFGPKDQKTGAKLMRSRAILFPCQLDDRHINL
jgi:hypothetical protein